MRPDREEVEAFQRQSNEFRAGYALAMKAIRGRYGSVFPVTSWYLTDLRSRTLEQAINEVAAEFGIDLDSAALGEVS